jgi:hypothetical protein
MVSFKRYRSYGAKVEQTLFNYKDYTPLEHGNRNKKSIFYQTD